MNQSDRESALKPFKSLKKKKGRLEKGYILPRQMETLFRYEDVLDSIKDFDTILMTMLTHTIKDFTIKESL